jgi:hypothetical protein
VNYLAQSRGDYGVNARRRHRDRPSTLAVSNQERLGTREAEMKIKDCDFHARQQTIAMVNTETGEVHDALSRFAQPFNSQLDHISGFEILRRLHSEPNPGGRAGADDVSGEQRHEFAHVRQERGNVEDHIGGGTVLASLPR